MDRNDFNANDDLNRDLDRDAARDRELDRNIVRAGGRDDLSTGDVDRTERLRDKAGHAADSNVVHHDSNPSVGDEVGEAAGGISGVLAGAAIGSAGGPIGTLIGGIAGAIGGWWAGRAVSEAASNVTHDDDAHYRTHYESNAGTSADRKYDDVRPAYHLGHLAAHNPDYSNRNFDAVETDLQRGWSKDLSASGGDWSSVRDYARTGYDRGRSTASTRTAGATGTAKGAASYYGDRTADRSASAGDASNLGHDAAHSDERLRARVDSNSNTTRDNPKGY